MIRAYLDANATTRPLPDVVEAVRHSMEADYLNASSAAAAFWSGDSVGNARRALARLLDAEPEEFLLTSGASESNSWAISLVPSGGQLVIGDMEHPSLREAAVAARDRGVEVVQVGSDRSGVVNADALVAAVSSRTSLVSVMLANNETGVLQPLGQIADAVRAKSPSTLIHSDATQAVGRTGISLAEELCNIDLLSLSAHKFHGPKGVGALFCRAGVSLPALVHGEQESGKRGGTYNLPGLAGLAVAAEHMRMRIDEWSTDVAGLRDKMESALLASVPGSRINGRSVSRLPNTCSITMPGVDAEALVDRLAAVGVCVATGSACSAGANAPSHVLSAMGLSPEDARATLRISLSIDTEWDEIAVLLGELTALTRAAA